MYYYNTFMRIHTYGRACTIYMHAGVKVQAWEVNYIMPFWNCFQNSLDVRHFFKKIIRQVKLKI